MFATWIIKIEEINFYLILTTSFFFDCYSRAMFHNFYRPTQKSLLFDLFLLISLSGWQHISRNRFFHKISFSFLFENPFLFLESSFSFVLWKFLFFFFFYFNNAIKKYNDPLKTIHHFIFIILFFEKKTKQNDYLFS